ncbi:MAG TPA: flagellar biosynthesis protein FlhA [Armatimonadota bacterium]|nr:flagellar biosynthesis protein FlhA [Armatimonadota bacterium]
MAQARATNLLAQGLPEQIARHSDLLVSGGAVLIVAMLVVPLPHWALDALLVINIGAALTVLLMTAYTTHVLNFSVFPSLLLITTLFRLAINVSATRLILLHANAGAVIAAFGSFVVGGNYVVGIVVFIILVVIQFVVITNGAGRVAEVAARFTLDAMPGKQMAIDADLNAGLIDETEARRRREQIAREADFYGAMDGASKFVRGDAIAAVVMIVVNIFGGFIIGLAQRGMDLPTALRTYTLLTVGEGLVTQIPALVMATATGLIITRSSSGAPLGRDLATQILGSPRALGLVALTLAALALVPGLPKLPFLLVASGVGLIAGTLRTPSQQRRAPAQPSRPAAPSAEQLVELTTVEPLELEIGLDLIPLADPAQGGDLLERISTLRRRIAEEMGLMVPPLRVRDNLTLRGSAYAIKLSGADVAQGEVRLGYVLVMSATGGPPDVAGIDATDPAFGMPARWVPEGRRVDAEMMGHTVVDPGTVILTHLEEVLKAHAAEIISLQDVRTMLDHLRHYAPALVEELVPKIFSISDLHRLLAGLLRERVPVRDLARILTTLAGHAPAVKDPEALAELARQGLSRTITALHLGEDRTLWVCALDPAAESELVSRARGEDSTLDAEWTERLVRSIKRQMERLVALGHSPLLLCGPAARPLVRALLERRAPAVSVLSHAEIDPEARLKSVGIAGLDDTNPDRVSGNGGG